MLSGSNDVDIKCNKPNKEEEEEEEEEAKRKGNKKRGNDIKEKRRGKMKTTSE